MQGRQLRFHRRDVGGHGLLEQVALLGRHALGAGRELQPPQASDLRGQRRDARVAQHDGTITFLHHLALTRNGLQCGIAFGARPLMIALGGLHRRRHRRQQRLGRLAQLYGVVDVIEHGPIHARSMPHPISVDNQILAHPTVVASLRPCSTMRTARRSASSSSHPPAATRIGPGTGGAPPATPRADHS